MAVVDTLIRHRIILNRLRSKPSTFKEILSSLERESDLNERKLDVSIRTFQRDIDHIRALYGIEIEFDQKSKTYKIVSSLDNKNKERLLEAFDILNLLNHKDRLDDYVQFEKRKPLGTENLYSIKQAISEKKTLQFRYDKFWDKVTTRTIEPYGLKECQNRWYLLGKNPQESIVKIFALDRISQLQVLSQKFDYPESFDMDEMFLHCFGIIGPDKDMQVEDVILSFTKFQGKYIKSLPLHHSQEILIDNDDELRIKLRIYPTFDLKKEILSFGSNVKVISPKSFKDEIIADFQSSLKLYHTD